VAVARGCAEVTDLLEARVDAPVGWPAEGDHRPATPCVAVPAPDEVGRLQQTVQGLTGALIDSRDQLAALRALIGVPIGSLDDDTALRLMLTEALELTGSDCAVLVRGDAVLVVGPGPEAAELRDRLTNRPAVAGPGPRPIELSVGGAVVAALGGTAGGHGCLGLARCPGPHYTTGDLKLVNAVVAAVDKLLTLTDLHRRAVQRAAVDREHQLASSLAQAMLPAAAPALAGAQVFARCVPARLAGGDFMVFDVVDGVLWFAVGDVAGKGLPAAVVMTMAVSAARVAIRGCPDGDPAAAVRAVGADLFDYLSGVGLFVTLAVGCYRPGSGWVQVANAGHSPIVTLTGGTVAAVPPSMPPIGVIRAMTGRTQRVRLTGNDLLVLGSDGLTEQDNGTGALYGYDRFHRAVADLAHLPVDRIGERLFAEVNQHAGNTPASDDRTLVVLREAPPPPAAPRPGH